MFNVILFFSVFLLLLSICQSNMIDLNLEIKRLHVPSLLEMREVLQTGLKSNFETVNVEVVDSPDLSQPPFTLACKGLGGSPKIVEIGGPPYLLPLVQREKVYELKDIAKLIGSEESCAIGAGAGPFPFVGRNCEGIINVILSKNSTEQHTRIAKVNDVDGSYIQERLPNTETRMALLGNLFFSRGLPGPVLKVYAKKRTGPNDFIASIRTTLQNHFKDKIVGLGGTFLLQTGKAKQHVMPDFSDTPLESDEDLNKWLKFYNMSAPLIAVGTLVSGDPGLDLRVQHFHSFSHHGDAGHYHIDTTPEQVEYLGYFNTGEQIYRIDRPIETHKFGRD